MPKAKISPSSGPVEELLREKSLILSKTQALTTMGLPETAPAAVGSRGVVRRAHRFAPRRSWRRARSGHSSHQCGLVLPEGPGSKPGHESVSRRAGGPLCPATRTDVEAMLSECLALLS